MGETITQEEWDKRYEIWCKKEVKRLSKMSRKQIKKEQRRSHFYKMTHGG